jgi:SAM-dependent methyltransferase
MLKNWNMLPSGVVRWSKKIFFFYKSSYSVTLSSDPIRWKIPYKNPLARVAVGCLPFVLKKPFLRQYVTERIVENAFALRNLDLPQGSTVLDLGATGSTLALQVAHMGYKVLAVDLLDYTFAHPNLSSRRWDILSDSLEPGSVDAALVISTVEHIGIPYYGGKDEPEGDFRAMQELLPLLKPGGLLLLTTPFGIATRTSLQRIYDEARLERLLQGYTVEKQQFFRRQEGSYWVESTLEEMRSVSSHLQTEGVVLVRARKPGERAGNL